MGSLGVPEMIIIFILALVLFGPKKLPEIGRTLGKAITEFKRASSELKTTFEREMQTIEQETKSIKEAANPYQYDTYNYDYSSYESQDPMSGGDPYDPASDASTESASATQGAESQPAEPPEGVIAHGSVAEDGNEGQEPEHRAQSAGEPASTSAEHKA